MPRPEYNEDIFQESTMTFGEHLEELRVRLFRAILGLVAGVIVGFCIGGYVVEAIKAPLENALVEHYTKVAEEDFKKAVAAAEEEGRLPPDQPKSVKDFLEKYLPEELRKEETVKKSVAAFLEKYLPEEMYVSTTGAHCPAERAVSQISSKVSNCPPTRTRRGARAGSFP